MRAEGLTAVLLVLPFPTVVLAVAAEDPGDAATGVSAFELAGQTHVDVCRQNQQVYIRTQSGRSQRDLNCIVHV